MRGSIECVDEFERARSRPKLIMNTSILGHSSIVYTMHIFKIFQDEHISGMARHDM